MRLPLRMPFSLDAAFTSVAASALVMPIEIARVWKLTNEILRSAWYGVRSYRLDRSTRGEYEIVGAEVVDRLRPTKNKEHSHVTTVGLSLHVAAIIPRAP